MNSLRSYVLLGAYGGLLFGILLSMEAQIASTGPWGINITGASGAILGATLYATQGWETLALRGASCAGSEVWGSLA